MLAQTALISLTDGMPELRASQYAKVVEWDASLMRIETARLAGHAQVDEDCDLASGEYLAKIRDALKSTKHGLWTRYLALRVIPERTAQQRIQAAEGRYIRSKPATVAGLPGQQQGQIVPSEPIYAVRDWTTGVYDQDQDESEEVMPEREVATIPQGGVVTGVWAEQQREYEERRDIFAVTDNLVRALETFDAGNRPLAQRLEDFARADDSVLTYRHEPLTAARVRGVAQVLLAWAEQLEESEAYATQTA